MNENHTTESPTVQHGTTSFLRGMVASTAAAGLFLFSALSILVLPCWTFLALLPLAAWPIWRYWCERSMFNRRLILDAAMLDDSWIRSLVYKGYLRQAWLLFVACVFVGLLGAVTRTLQEQHWYLLAADALLLPMLFLLMHRLLRGHARPAVLQLTARQWPLSTLNVGLLAIGFMLVDFFFGALDTRGQALGTVFMDGYREFSGRATCEAIGIVCGFISGLDRIVWHVRESAIPLLPENWLRFLAWGLSLLQAGILAVAFNALLTGAIMLSAKPPESEAADLPYGTALQAFILTILVLACAVLGITAYSEQLQVNNNSVAVMPADSAPKVVPCPAPDSLSAPLHTGLLVELQQTTTMAHTATEQLIRQHIHMTFQKAGPGVDRYLDWYYTVTGEYERLIAMAAGDISQQLGQRLIEEAFGGVLETELAKTAQAAESEVESIFGKFAKNTGIDLQLKITSSHCLAQSINSARLTSLERDIQRAGTAAAIGTVTGGATAKALAAKVGNTVAAKVALKKFAKTAAAAATKAAAKKGSGALLAASGATLFCAPTGPVAVACGIGAGVLTWFGMDTLFIKTDELMNRAEAKREIMAVLETLEGEVVADLIALQHALILTRTKATETEIGKVFVPARDGV